MTADPANPRTLASAWAAGPDALYRLADQLWAENEQLRIENKNLQGDMQDSDHHELVRLRAENERLKQDGMLARAILNELDELGKDGVYGPLGTLRSLVQECARLRAQLDNPIIAWCSEQLQRDRKLVALISPTEAHDGPRYAGYYCEDAPLLNPNLDDR